MADIISNIESVFHAYDIRGLAGEELDEQFYYLLGIATARYYKASKIAIGRDFRKDSLKYQKAMIKGALSEGASIVDIGEIATEMLYFATGSDQSFDCGAVVTASHNPAQYNGCKIVGRGASACSKESGLFAIRDIMVESVKSGEQNSFMSQQVGEADYLDIYPAFKEKITSFLDKSVYNLKIKIAVDAGNGIGGKLFDYLFSDLNISVQKMFFEPDGNFPNHTPDPLKEENVKDIKKMVLDKKLDLGIAIDGDGDRVFFIDSKGRNPTGVYTGAFFIPYLVKEGDMVIHDPRLTWSISHKVKQIGAIPVISKAGHSYFKEKMKEHKAVFGAEVSSHFFYKDFYYADSGMISIVIMLNALANGADFAASMDYYYENYPNSGEVNFKVDSVEKTLEKVENHFKEGKTEKIDGISIEFDDWRFNLRGSNTQPLIRLNLEAKNKELVKQKYLIMQELIGGVRENEPAISLV